MTFIDFLKCNNLFTQSNELTTHLLMNGGKLHIQDHFFPIFLKEYYNALKNNEQLFLVEKLGKNVLMRFFLDIDFKNYLQDIHIFKQILTKAESILQQPAFILECSHQKGYHLIFPNKIVNYNEACELASKIGFPKYIDLSVYNTGLRMMGSCKFTAKKIENRQYLPLEPFTFDNLKKSIVRLKINPVKLNNICQTTSINNNKDFHHLLKYIAIIHENYKNITLHKIKVFNSYISITTNSHFCTNKNDFHKNAYIYFVISPDYKIYQKCFCPCFNQEPFSINKKPCKIYKSKHVNIPFSIYNNLISLES